MIVNPYCINVTQKTKHQDLCDDVLGHIYAEPSTEFTNFRCSVDMLTIFHIVYSRIIFLTDPFSCSHKVPCCDGE